MCQVRFNALVFVPRRYLVVKLGEDGAFCGLPESIIACSDSELGSAVFETLSCAKRLYFVDRIGPV